MKLRVENFAKIRQADISVDGITVIAGENDTGKSTIGKILFSLFNATSDIDEKIRDRRGSEISAGCREIIRNYRSHVILRDHGTIGTALKISSRIEKLLKEEEIHYDMLRRVVKSELKSGLKPDSEVTLLEMTDKICSMAQEIFNLPQQIILEEIISRYFGNVFSRQINSLREPETLARLVLDIKGKKTELQFINNICGGYSSEIEIMNKAIYIANPFLVDQLCERPSAEIIERSLVNMLSHYSGDDVMEGVIGSILAREKLSEIYQKLGNVISGNIIQEDLEQFCLEQEGFQDPISVNNLSTGLKSFLILKMLLEGRQINNKDVLILDEPEIHLHPQWQIAYAELIVLLQKYFDLSIVVTTHSPYFLDAINLFSVKYGLMNKVNYYLASVTDGWVGMEDVTENIDKIYQMMASPIQILDTLRHELNNNLE